MCRHVYTNVCFFFFIFFLNFFSFIYFMCQSFATWLTWCLRSEGDMGCPITGVTYDTWTTCRCWEPNQDPLQESLLSISPTTFASFSAEINRYCPWKPLEQNIEKFKNIFEAQNYSEVVETLSSTRLIHLNPWYCQSFFFQISTQRLLCPPNPHSWRTKW